MTNKLAKIRDEKCLEWLKSGNIPMELGNAFDEGWNACYEQLKPVIEACEYLSDDSIFEHTTIKHIPEMCPACVSYLALKKAGLNGE